jgi:cytochrome P450
MTSEASDASVGRAHRVGTSPPGPKGQFLLGSLVPLARDAFGFLRHCAQEYGDMVSLRLVGWPAIFLNSPAALEEMLIKQHDKFIKHRFYWRHVRGVFGQGLFLSEGAFWHRQRRLAAPAFTPRRVASYAENMVRHVEGMATGWKPGERRDLHADMMALTLIIACDTFFRVELKSDVAEIGRAVNAIADEMALRRRRLFAIPDWVPLARHRRYRRAIRTIERMVYAIIRERQRDGRDRGDLLSVLVSARDEAGRPMPDRQLRDEVVTLLLAGQETTALVLTWMFYLLGTHPEADARLAAELESVLNGRAPAAEDLPKLPYAEHVALEAMRLYPPVWVFGREATADCVIGGYPVPAGTTLLISPWVTHRDPRLYDDPLAFQPERWENGLARKLPRLAYFPFSGGPRVCLGAQFAMQELTLVLAGVAQRYRLKVMNKEPIEPSPSITLRPKQTIWVEPEMRQ